MADNANQTNGDVTRHVDAQKDVQAPAQAANHEASVKGAQEVYGEKSPGTDKPADKPVDKPADKPADSAGESSWTDNLAKSAADAWSAGVKAAEGVTDFQDWFNASATKPDAGNDASRSGAKGYLDFVKNDWVAADARSGADQTKVEAKNGNVSVDNDSVAMTHSAQGGDTVRQKSTGDVYNRNPDGTIDEKAADRQSKFSKDSIVDNFGFASFERQLGKALPDDVSGTQAGHVVEGSDGIAYRNRFHSADGGGTITARNDKTITINEDNGDTLVLNGNTQQATFTAKGGKPETMSVDEYRAKHGDTFAHFHLDNARRVHSDDNGVTVENGDNGPKLTATNLAPGTGDKVEATVTPQGQSDLKHTDAAGGFISESRVNYNDPSHAYEQLDKSGKVCANYDSKDGKFNVGKDFAFTDQGTSIGEGNVFVCNDGSFTADASDSVISDGSVSYESTSSSGSSEAASSEGGSSESGLGSGPLAGMSAASREEIISEIQSAKSEVGAAMTEANSITAAPGSVDASMLSTLSGAADTVQSLMDASGGRLQLSPILAAIQNKEGAVASTLDRAKTGKEPSDVKFVDFADKDIYAA